MSYIIIIITNIVIFILLCTYQQLFWGVEPWDLSDICTRMYTNPPTQQATITPPPGAIVNSDELKPQTIKCNISRDFQITRKCSFCCSFYKKLSFIE